MPNHQPPTSRGISPTSSAHPLDSRAVRRSKPIPPSHIAACGAPPPKPAARPDEHQISRVIFIVRSNCPSTQRCHHSPNHRNHRGGQYFEQFSQGAQANSRPEEERHQKHQHRERERDRGRSGRERKAQWCRKRQAPQPPPKGSSEPPFAALSLSAWMPPTISGRALVGASI